MKNYIAYYRVSTAKQGRSGLGLQAQQDTVKNFLGSNGNLVAEYTEVQSGKSNARVELLKAIAQCKQDKATLLIAKLDRLSRNVAFIFELRNSGVDFVCCDLPDLNTLTLGIFATFAQHEAERISQRTKDGLRAAKRKGVVLGMPANLTKQARAKGMKARINNARTATANIQASELIKMYNKDGLSLRTIASKLNESGYTTRRGAEFTAMQVKRLLDR